MKFIVQVPSSDITIKFDSFDATFKMYLTEPIIVVADKLIPNIYLLPQTNGESQTTDTSILLKTKLSLKSLSESQIKSADCFGCYGMEGCACCSSNGTCIECETGYTLGEMGCEECLISDCNLCSTTSYGCANCTSGVPPDSDGQCNICKTIDKYCFRCEEGMCIECEESHILSSDGSCFLCENDLYKYNETTCGCLLIY
ncbi:hypothetical protein QTN25_000167 [Entamoeba marina]